MSLDTALYIVATPIGNLADISQRALQVLAEVDMVLAEDTRHSQRLLRHYGITAKLHSCHEHNELDRVDWVTENLTAGKSIALISDAGTPLISDPGFKLVRALREQGEAVIPVPGPSSIIAALSVAGLPTDAFVYDGFLPSKRGARQAELARYVHEWRTAVVLESSHRIQACLNDVHEVLGADREIVLARELTKRFETVLSGTAKDILARVTEDTDQQRGEFVMMISGVGDKKATQEEHDVEAILRVLLTELSVKQATKLTAKISGQGKNELYKIALKLNQDTGDC